MPMRQLCEFHECKNLRWFLINPDEQLNDYSFIVPYVDAIEEEYHRLMNLDTYNKFYQKADFIGYEELKMKALKLEASLFKQREINEMIGVSNDKIDELIKTINESFMFDCKDESDCINLHNSIDTMLTINWKVEKVKEEKPETWDELVVWVQTWIGILMDDSTTISRFCEYHKRVKQKIEWQKSN